MRINSAKIVQPLDDCSLILWPAIFLDPGPESFQRDSISECFEADVDVGVQFKVRVAEVCQGVEGRAANVLDPVAIKRERFYLRRVNEKVVGESSYFVAVQCEMLQII